MQHSKFIIHNLLFLSKRNGTTQSKAGPAFRSNAAARHQACASGSITTAIGASLLTSLHCSKACYYTAIRVLISLFVFSGITACENDMNEVERLTKANRPQYDHAEEVEILYSEDGMVKAKINAPELVKDSNGRPYTEFSKGIRVEILNSAQKPVTVLTANYGKRYDKSEETIVQNDVVVINKNGDKLETEELTRNDKTGELHTDAFVKITTANEVLYGMGLKANEDFSYYQIDTVQGFLNINETDFLVE